MRYDLISVGDRLRLKRDRAAAYGLTDAPTVLVTAKVPRRGYAVPWIVSGPACFMPSDFAEKSTDDARKG